MKKIIAILLVILSMSCQSQQKNTMEQEKVKFYPKDLVSIKSMPKSEDINSVELKKGIPSVSTLLSKSLFFKALDHNNTRILNLDNKLDSKLLADRSYSPWYIIDFTTVKGNYKIKLFLGGLGFVTTPNGKRGAVLFDFSDLKKDEESRLIKYFDKLKRGVNLLGRIFEENKELGVDGGIVTSIAASNTLKINNIYPHPSKEFSENFDIIEYQVKNNDGEISFWRADRQILKTNKVYPKMVANFVAAAESLITQQGTYNQTIRLLKGNVLIFPDGLKIDLAYFSHKMVYENQISPAIAHLELSDKYSETKMTIQKNQSINKQGKLITSYYSGKWKNYNIELTGLVYGDYVDIIVSKFVEYNTTISLRRNDTILFPDEFEITLARLNHKKTLDPQEAAVFAILKIKENDKEKSYNIGKSIQRDGLGGLVRVYGSVNLKNHQIILTNWSPLEIKVFKKNNENLYVQEETYNTKIRLREKHLIVFSDGFKIEVGDFVWEGNSDKIDIEIELKISNNTDKITTFYIKKYATESSIINIGDYKIEVIDLIEKPDDIVKLYKHDFLDVRVAKKTDKSENFMDVTNELSTDEFEQIKNFILKSKDRQTYRNFDNNNPHYAFIDFDLYLGADIGQKNMNNNSNLSGFNELTIKHNILGAPIQYYTLIIVRKGDIKKGKFHLLQGMEENKVYLVDYYEDGLENLQSRLPLFLETIRKRINLTEKE